MPSDGDAMHQETREVVERSKRMVRHTAIVGAFRALNPLLGIIREIIMAHFLGTRAAADIYRFVVDRILVELYTKVEKLLQPTFLPIFVSRQTLTSDTAAFRFANVMGTLVALILTGISFAGVLWADKFVAFMLHYLRQDIANFELAVWMVRITFPFLIFYCLSNVLELTLQSYTNFTLPALAEALRRILLVGGFAVVAFLVHEPTDRHVVVAATIGAIGGITLRLLVQLPGLRGKFRYIRPSLELSNSDLQRAGILMLPLLLGVAFASLRSWVEVHTAGRIGEGVLAALGYARKFVDQPWQIIAYAISVVIYPFISELGAKRERGELGDALLSVFRIMVFVFVPVSIIMVTLSKALVCGLLKGADPVLILSALVFYLPGMTIFALDEPTMKWFYALGDTLTPTILGIIADFIFFGILFGGVYGIGAGLPAFALALVISKGLKILAVYTILHRRLGGLAWHRLIGFAIRMVVACAILTTAMWFMGRMAPDFEAGRLAHLGFLVIGGIIGVGVFAGCAYLLRMEEMMLVIERIGNAMRKRLRAR